MASKAAASIGVVLGSSRKPRCNPQVTQFVTETYQQWASSKNKDSTPPNLQLIDLAEWNLPFFDESGIPSEIHDPAEYDHEHTRKWSSEIQKHSAIMFITPQYNWGYPAVLKNAIDFLYNEWKGKPALIVSYGGRGGGKSSAQLREVLHGVRMEVAETSPALAFPSRDVLFAAATGKDFGTTGEASIWNAQRPSLFKSFDELSDLLNARSNS